MQKFKYSLSLTWLSLGMRGCFFFLGFSLWFTCYEFLAISSLFKSWVVSAWLKSEYRLLPKRRCLISYYCYSYRSSSMLETLTSCPSSSTSSKSWDMLYWSKLTEAYLSRNIWFCCFWTFCFGFFLRDRAWLKTFWDVCWEFGFAMKLIFLYSSILLNTY